MPKIKDELMKKYKDILNKPFCEFTDNDWKKLNKALDENNEIKETCIEENN